MDPADNLDWPAIEAKLREQYVPELVQEMLLKLWRSKTSIKNPIAYAKSCWKTIHQEELRSRQRRSRELLTFEGKLPESHTGEDPLARAIARQEIERAPGILVADELGIRPRTPNSTARVQRHRARRKARVHSG